MKTRIVMSVDRQDHLPLKRLPYIETPPVPSCLVKSPPWSINYTRTSTLSTALKVRHANTDLWDNSMERAPLVPQLFFILLRSHRQLAEVARRERNGVVIELEYDTSRRFRAYRNVKLRGVRSQTVGYAIREGKCDIQRRLIYKFQLSNASQ